MKTIGEKFPYFEKEALVSLEADKEFKTLTLDDLAGKWTVFFWWPMDFTFVCPTEIVSFNEHFEEFQSAMPTSSVPLPIHSMCTLPGATIILA
jgi:peroxiredoxin (alkyl hydroperoxide reductase subunit C)